MATRRVKLTGIGEWAKVFASNRDMLGYDGAYREFDGACTIDVILDEDNMAALKASRSIKKGKPDPQGRGHLVRFVRKFNTGKDWDSGAPVVVKADDTPWDYDVDGTIGNGYIVEVLLSVYDTSKPNIVGTRLDKVKVLEHVEYVRDEGDSPPPSTDSKPVAGNEVLF